MLQAADLNSVHNNYDSSCGLLRDLECALTGIEHRCAIVEQLRPASQICKHIAGIQCKMISYVKTRSTKRNTRAHVRISNDCFKLDSS